MGWGDPYEPVKGMVAVVSVVGGSCLLVVLLFVGRGLLLLSWMCIVGCKKDGGGEAQSGVYKGVADPPARNTQQNLSLASVIRARASPTSSSRCFRREASASLCGIFGSARLVTLSLTFDHTQASHAVVIPPVSTDSPPPMIQSQAHTSGYALRSPAHDAMQIGCGYGFGAKRRHRPGLDLEGWEGFGCQLPVCATQVSTGATVSDVSGRRDGRRWADTATAEETSEMTLTSRSFRRSILVSSSGSRSHSTACAFWTSGSDGVDAAGLANDLDLTGWAAWLTAVFSVSCGLAGS